MVNTNVLAGEESYLMEQDGQYAKWIWLLRCYFCDIYVFYMFFRDHWRYMFGTAKNPFTLPTLTKQDVDLYLNEDRMRQRYRLLLLNQTCV